MKFLIIMTVLCGFVLAKDDLRVFDSVDALLEWNLAQTQKGEAVETNESVKRSIVKMKQTAPTSPKRKSEPTPPQVQKRAELNISRIIAEFGMTAVPVSEEENATLPKRSFHKSEANLSREHLGKITRIEANLSQQSPVVKISAQKPLPVPPEENRTTISSETNEDQNISQIVAEFGMTVVPVPKEENKTLIRPVRTVTVVEKNATESNLSVALANPVKTDSTGEANVTIINYITKEEVNRECKTTSKLPVDFWQLLDQAMVRSAALLLKKHDIRVTAANIDIIKSQLFPTLSLRYQSEYYHGFSSGSSASIGGQYYPPISEYRDSLSLNLDYELYRFGAKGLKTEIAEKDLQIMKSEFAMTQERIANQLLQYYTDALKAQENIRYLGRIRLMQDTLMQKFGRLFEAGETPKTQIMQAQIEKMSTQKTILQSRQRLSSALRDIDILTGIKLDPKMVDLAMLEPGRKGEKSFEESAVARNLQLKIDKKLREIALIEKDKLPTLYANGGYLLYGKDEDTPIDAIGAIERNNWSVGLNLRWNLFDGFKTDSSVKKAEEELRKLKEQYRLAKEEFEAQRAKRAALKEAIDKILKEESALLDAICKQKEMYEKLHKAGTMTQLQTDRTEISRLRSELSFKLQVIDRAFEEIADELVF